MSIFKEEYAPKHLDLNPLRNARTYSDKFIKQWLAFLISLPICLSIYYLLPTPAPKESTHPLEIFENALKDPNLSKDQATAIIQQLLEKWPESDQAYLIAGQYLIKKGHYSQALNTLSWRPEPFSDHKEYYATLAFIYLQMQTPKPALEIYLALTQMESKNPKWWLGLGTSYDLINQPDQARSAWEHAKKLASPSASYYTVIDERLSQSVELT
ncbi:MAG: hypothetical protein FJ186_02710 [Gammaproteobacteria bacterium]|nr:hypothetical protein [Gammaproteobacteria bacterium]